VNGSARRSAARVLEPPAFLAAVFFAGAFFAAVFFAGAFLAGAFFAAVFFAGACFDLDVAALPASAERPIRVATCVARSSRLVIPTLSS